MEVKKLKIFKKNKGIYFYAHHWLFIILSIVIIVLISVEFIYGLYLIEHIFISIAFLFLCMVVVEIRNQFLEQREIGKYSGEIIFSNTKIQIDKNVFEISEILKLDFIVAWDIRNRHKVSYSFSPRLSHGLDNILELKLKNGKVVRINFLQTEWQRLKLFEEILVHYFKKGIIEWHSLLKILGIKKYSDIQKFKKELC